MKQPEQFPRLTRREETEVEQFDAYGRSCFDCGATGHCEHREPDVALAVLYALRQAKRGMQRAESSVGQQVEGDQKAKGA